MKILIYDIEIKKAILGRNEVRQTGIEYAEGWDDPDLGVSCLVAAEWDVAPPVVADLSGDLNDLIVTGGELVAARPREWDNASWPVYHVFMEDNLPLFQELVERAEVLVGFNTVKFDNPHLERAGIRLGNKTQFDMLREMWIASGLDPDNFNPRTHGGFSLRQTLETNLPHLTEKQDNGAWAPVLFQRGKLGGLVNYCLKDVRLELELLRHLWGTAGLLISPKTREAIRLTLPWQEAHNSTSSETPR